MKSDIMECKTSSSDNEIIAFFQNMVTENKYATTDCDLDYKTVMEHLSATAAKLNKSASISVFGSPKLISKFTEHICKSQSKIGSVDLDTATAVTYDNRVYRFISTDKMRDNDSLIIIP